MATANAHGIRHTIERVKRFWAEIDYAQKRSFEIRTGVPAFSRHERVRPSLTVEELDSLYELDEDELAA